MTNTSIYPSLEKLVYLSNSVLDNTETKHKRALFDQIDWTQRLIFVTGFRGSGKTTLLIQKLQEFNPSKSLYITADSIEIGTQSLFELALEWQKYGGKYLVIDEIQKYPNWVQEIKNIYDLIPNLKVFASGSSGISILKGQFDISRRSLIYTLNGLSFREYLNFKHGLDLKVVKFDNILDQSQETSQILNILKRQDLSILAEFKEYLQAGFYPYFLESNKDTYLQKLHNSISKVLYEDILTTFNLNNSATIYLKKLISLVANSVPFTPNIESLATSLKISKETVYNYLDYLTQAQVFISLKSESSGLKSIRKADKIYLNNSNLYYSLASNIEIGSIREVFFANQMQTHQKNEVLTHKKVDFCIDEKLFEIGAQNKLNQRTKYPENTYFVLDELEYGSKNIIPLWLIGFLG